MQSQTVDIKVDIRVLRDNRSNSAVRAHAEETGSCYWPKKSDVCKEVKIHSNFHQPPQIHSKLKANESSCGESSAAWTLILFFFFFLQYFHLIKVSEKKQKTKPTHPWLNILACAFFQGTAQWVEATIWQLSLHCYFYVIAFTITTWQVFLIPDNDHWLTPISRPLFWQWMCNRMERRMLLWLQQTGRLREADANCLVVGFFFSSHLNIKKKCIHFLKLSTIWDY